MDGLPNEPLQHSGENSTGSPVSSLDSGSTITVHASPAGLVQHLGLPTLVYTVPVTPNTSPTGSNHGDFAPLSSNGDTSTPALGITPEKTSPTFIDNQSLLVLGDVSVKGFLKSAQVLFHLFHNSAKFIKPFPRAPLDDVVRLAIWWFLQACMASEPLLRDGSSSPFAEQENRILLQQARISLAKSLWILQETIKLDYGTSRQSSVRTTVDNRKLELSSLRLALLIQIRQLLWSMQRHGFVPQLSEAVSTLEVADTSIRVPYPPLVIDIAYLITGDDTVDSDKQNRILPLSVVFPLGDTESAFCYGRMHVDICLVATSSHKRVRYAGILSVVRGRDEKNISVIMGTQHGLLNLSIGSGWENHPTWADVSWFTSITSLEVKLRTGFRLQIHCQPWDFKLLRDMYDFYSETLSRASQPSSDEILIFNTDIKFTQYHTARESGPRGFPKGPIPNCTFRIFEKRVLQQAGTGPRKHHRGFRVTVLTPPSVRGLRALCQVLSPVQAIQFSFLQEDTVNSTISLKIGPDSRGDSLTLAFTNPQQRSTLLAHLTGCFVHEGEDALAQVKLSSFSISTRWEAPIPDQAFDEFHWQSLRVINKHPTNSETLGVKSSNPVLSESLRIIVDSPNARIADRLNIGLGELRIRRNVVASGHQLHVLRQPQKDMTFSLSGHADTRDEIPERLGKALVEVKTQPSIRTYVFPSLSELHLFQSAITGFSVLFDGLAVSFSISRRRMIVPIHKEWSAPHTRIQILRQARIFQLVAFFEGFSHGKCMNFALKETDIFQISTKGKKSVLKIADAKFSLPAGGEGVLEYEAGFACLDVLEYPEEHNNIYIGFDGDADFTKFIQALPATLKRK